MKSAQPDAILFFNRLLRTAAANGSHRWRVPSRRQFLLIRFGTFFVQGEECKLNLRPVIVMNNKRLLRRRLIASTVLPLFLNPWGGIAVANTEFDQSPDPLAIYGDEIRFDVMRNGQSVGWHRTTFFENGTELEVLSVLDLQIDFLFFTAFRFRYESEASWRNGALERLKARTDDDGARSSFEAVRDGASYVIENERETYNTRSPVYPTDHWNSAVLQQQRVLNTLTGRINEVQITPVNRETVETERGPVMATRYSYTGDLETEVWYDDAGRWVKLRFAARDGSTIEYHCRRCQGSNVRRAVTD